MPALGEPNAEAAVLVPPTRSVAVLDQADTPSAADHPTRFELRLPGLEVLDELGSGGMGRVYRALETRLHREVAVKILRDPLAGKDLRRRFEQEAQILANLSHPNIIPVYAANQSEGWMYFVMKCVRGGTLAARTPSLRGSARRIVEVIAKVADAVHHLHEKGVYHRDLKPSNILLDGDEPLVTDFGVAKWSAAREHTVGPVLFGTYAYMSPEMASRGAAASGRPADVWAVGVMLHELLTGRLPFLASDHTALLEMIQTCPPAAIHLPTAAPGTDAALAAVVRRALAHEVKDRYATAGELRDDLKCWLASEPIPVRVVPPVTEPKPKRRWRAALAAVAAGLVAAMVLPSPVPWRVEGAAARTHVERTISERLTAGETVTLIDSNGSTPEGHTLVPGMNGGVSRSAHGLELGAPKLALLDLSTAELPYPVRLHAEVYHSDFKPSSFVGIYARRLEHPQPSGKSCHSMYANAFQGARIDGDRRQGDGAAYASEAWVVPHDPYESAYVHGPREQQMKVPFQARQVPGQPPEYRELTLDIHPDRILAIHAGQPFKKAVAHNELRGSFRLFTDARRLAFREPGYGDALGVYVRFGAATFRNVTLTRLPD